MIQQILTGHTSPETAYVVDDYPYGFRLRCKIRYWLERKPNHGYRLVSQTTNPKKSFEVWNKPKASTYCALGVMGLDDLGHVSWTGLSGYSSDETIADFRAKYFEYLDADQLQDLKKIEFLSRASKRITYTVTNGNGPRQTDEEAKAIWKEAIHQQIQADKNNTE